MRRDAATAPAFSARACAQSVDLSCVLHMEIHLSEALPIYSGAWERGWDQLRRQAIWGARGGRGPVISIATSAGD